MLDRISFDLRLTSQHRGCFFRRLAAWLTIFVATVNSSRLYAADDEDELPVYHAGLVGTYSQAQFDHPVDRVDDDVQFVWNGGPPDRRLAVGPFTARWRGRLFVMSPGAYRLQLFVAGRTEVRINGQSIVKAESESPSWYESVPITLSYGYHPLEIDYAREGERSATLKLYWSGPQFGVEPIPERHLFHDPAETPKTQFDEGAQLVRALRCGACHDLKSDPQPLPAPTLTHLTGNLDPAWMVEHLTSSAATGGNDAVPTRRRMPHLGMTREDAAAVVAYLFSNSQKSSAVKVPVPDDPPPSPAPPATESKKKPKPRTKPSVTIGRQLTHTLGCLACHRLGELGSDGPFAGSELTQVAAKRTPEFFVRWLDDAAHVNVDRRMPQFKLDGLETADLASFLATLGVRWPDRGNNFVTTEAEIDRGRALVAEHRCAACHRLPSDAAKPLRTASSVVPMNDKPNCLGEPDVAKHRPGYRLTDSARAAVVEYLRSSAVAKPSLAAAEEGRFVLAERNCLGCHSRGLKAGLAERVPAVTAASPELLPVQAALLPPSLNGVGDKLTDESFLAAVKTDRPPLRSWLKVRMPKFALSDAETKSLQTHLVDHDRIPDRPAPAAASSDETAQRLAARRLVTADGFGCTSCHKIGAAEPSGTIAIAAMGTDLTMVGDRLRKSWFDRWVRNPARIIPRMEMPAVQLPVQGVLHDDVHEQLAAVWKVLNEPGFTPPKPNPVRIVRARNVPGLKEPPHVLSDLFTIDDKTYVSPIVIGLPNRHNVLFDLENNRLAAWWTGDTALERTKGKGWYWEPGGATVFPVDPAKREDSDVHFYADAKIPLPIRRTGQDVAVLDAIERTENRVTIIYRIQIQGDSSSYVRVRQSFEPLASTTLPPTSGFRRTLEFDGLGWALLDPLSTTRLAPTNDRAVRRLDVPGNARAVDVTVRTTPNNAPFLQGPFISNGDGVKSTRLVVDYLVDLPLDTFPNEVPPLPNPPPAKLDVVPGYDAVRLPLPAGEMPTGLAWMKDGTLLVASLKGRILAARDTNGDDLEDVLTPVSDDLATPYGLAVAVQDGREVIDVITKTALVRLHDDDRDGFYERQEIAADGWGHTDDYHDWAVGLPAIRDANGKFAGYFVALPCQQDERDEAKARLRGQAIKLIPREPTKDDPRRFRVEPFCGGLRFPMGLAVDGRGELFATDNQGHYNPFNELNHLQHGKRYGYINKLERVPGFNPPTESPAIEIPHPWTRSVNGICFLSDGLRDHVPGTFGAFTGHLLGCEFNQRSLIRMSLETVDGVNQGAAYPFSIQPEDPATSTFEGPHVVAVARDGDLYVGNLLDSGWGGGRNTGSIVRLKPNDKLPPGIAEVRAAADGFAIRFTAEIDREKLAMAKNFVIERYRRESTPQYGGDDKDRTVVKVTAVEPSADGREVRLRCDKLEAGFVYEFHLQNLAADGATFFPAEAHYTLKRVPRGDAK